MPPTSVGVMAVDGATWLHVMPVVPTAVRPDGSEEGGVAVKPGVPP